MSVDPTPDPSQPIPPSTATVSDPAKNQSSTEPAPGSAQDDDYRLTPELVEEEAIRGDFMIRWAVILFALLLGWTVVSDTLTLVRIRSGQYMVSHGVLPPRTDVFSTAAEGRTWVNLGWLGDLVLAGAYQIGGQYALTILAAILAAVTFRFVVQTSMTGISTWWGSLIAMLAAVACFSHLTPNSIWMLLGVAVTCRLLQRFDDDPSHPSLWPLVPVFWLWANLDRHMFVGMAVLLLWGIGRSATNISLQPPKRVDLSRIWLPIGVTCLAVMIHPWHYHVWTAPWLSLGVEFPEVRLYETVTPEFLWQWHSIVSERFWDFYDIFAIFGLVTAGIAMLTMIVNLKEVPFEHLLWYFGINGLAAAAGYFLPAATIVNVVIATLNGQAWYRRSFRQEYSVNALALAYSRGGRALTVLSVFGLSYLAITGFLMGAAGRRIGTGFEQELGSNIASYEQLLPIGPEVDERRPFNFRPEEGDLLIWVGEKPFVDRRITLFATGGKNLLEVHRQTRLAILIPTGEHPLQGKKEVWQETFREHELNLALPRLSGSSANYRTYISLLLQPEDWYPVSLGAATATFYWINDEPAIKAFVEDQEGWDPLPEAFQNPTDEPPDMELDWPTEPTFTDKYLLLPNPAIPNGIQLAHHYHKLLTSNLPWAHAEQLALAYLIVRNARHGLSENPNIADGWRLLSEGYESIYVLDSSIVAVPPLRKQQAIAARQLAQIRDPDSAYDEWVLANLLSDLNELDLAIEHFKRFEELTGRVAWNADDPNYEEIANGITNFVQQTSADFEVVKENVAENLANEESRFEMVVGLQRSGMPGLALDLLEEERTLAEHDFVTRTVFGNLLGRNGDWENAWMTLEQEAESYSQPEELSADGAGWFGMWSESAALANLVAGNPGRAVEIYEDIAQFQLTRTGVTVIDDAPLTDRAPQYHGVWGAYRGAVLTNFTRNVSERWVSQQWFAACAEIEAQQHQQAVDRLTFVLERQPDTGYRPLIVIYLSMLTGETYYFRPNSEVPIYGGMFAPDAAGDEADSENVPADEPDTAPPEPQPADPSGSDPGEPEQEPTSEATDADQGAEDMPNDEPPPPPESEEATSDESNSTLNEDTSNQSARARTGMVERAILSYTRL